MARWISQPGVAPAAVGAAILAQMAAARWLFTADTARVYFAGHPINLACAFHQQTGLPCPTCGISRAIVFALHGDWTQAWRMAPGGPAFVAGFLAVALALLALAAMERSGAAWRGPLLAGIRRGGLAYAGAAAVVWLGGWVTHLSAAWYAR